MNTKFFIEAIRLFKDKPPMMNTSTPSDFGHRNVRSSALALRMLVLLAALGFAYTGAAQLTVTPPSDANIECDESTDPSNTGIATATGGCAPWINEIHYDNDGTDSGEFIEVAGPAGFDLTGWTIVLYNGTGGAVYDTDPLVGLIDDEGMGYGAVHITYPSNGIQNGSPDGIALVNPGGMVQQFISYEGTFVGVGGPANGMLSVDIGVQETDDPPLNESLQLVGGGAFVWVGPDPQSPGSLNAGQIVLSGGISITFADSSTPGNCPDAETITRTWTATDVCGNTDTANQTINVDDTTPPTISCPADVTVNEGDPTDPLNTGMPSNLSDNCDTQVGATFQDAMETNCPAAPDRIIRTWSAADECGNVTTCVQSIWITCSLEVQCEIICPPNPPIIEWPAGFNIEPVQQGEPQDPSVSPDIYGFAQAQGDCGQFTITFQDQLTMVGNCPDSVWRLDRVWILTDAAGNTYQCTQTFWFSDTTDPDISCAQTGIPPVECGDPIPEFPPFATDNCDQDIDLTYVDTESLTGQCPLVMVITRTWYATDNCGNVGSCTQLINVYDTTPPSITCPDDVTLDFSGSSTDPSETGFATATDNCGTPEITYVDVLDFDNCPFEINKINRHWRATDDCGLVTTCIQFIWIPCEGCQGACDEADTEGPVMDCSKPAPVCADHTITSSELIALGYADAQDNCDPDPNIYVIDSSMVAFGCTQTWTYSFTAVDMCGNQGDTCAIIVTTTVDIDPPVITCTNPPHLGCNPTAIPTPQQVLNAGYVTATDDCGPATIGLIPPVTNTSNGCERFRTYRFRATDICGRQSAICTVTLQWTIDTIPPDITCPGDIYLQCPDDPIPAPSTTSVIVSDDCSIDYVTWVGDVSDGLTCPETITRTYAAADSCGNVSSCTQYIIINDTIPPAIQCPETLVLECIVDTVPVTFPIVSDNCTDTLFVTYTDVEYPQQCDNFIFVEGYDQVLLVIVRTHYATDDCGNTSSCTQHIIIRDDTPPMLSCPADVTIECTDDPDDLELTGVASAVDMCDPDAYATILITLEAYSSPCSTVLTRYWTATDSCGNGNSGALCLQMITILDTTPPSITCPDPITIECGVELPFTTATATDNCNEFFLTYADGDPIGLCPMIVTRTHYAEDACGNVSSCTQYIYIEDTTPPNLTCPDHETIECGDALPQPSWTVNDICDPQVDVTYVDAEPCAVGFTGVYDFDNWFVQEPNGGNVETEDFAEVTLTSPDGEFCFEGMSTLFGITIPADDTLVFCWSYETFDSFDDPFWDPFGYNLNGTFFQLTENGGPIHQHGVATVIVQQGDVFAFEALSIDCIAGAGATTVVGFIDCSEEATEASCETIVLRTYYAEDDCGNVSSCVQCIFIDDTTPPDIVCPANLTLECAVDTIPVTTATATDICDEDVDLTYTDEEFPQECDNLIFIDGVDQVLTLIVRTHYATDDCGNVSSCTQHIIIRDDTPPMVTCPADVTIECDEDINNLELTGVPIVTDLCDPEPSVTILITLPTFVSPCSSTYTRVWQATDHCNNGNSAGVCIQNITVLDTEAPLIVCPEDLTLECGDQLPVTSASATDNCNEFTLTYSDHICSDYGFTGDFDFSNWTAIEPANGGDVTTVGDQQVILTGPDGGCPGGNNTVFSIVVPEGGTLVFQWSYHSNDGDGSSWDPFGFTVNGNFSQLTDDGGPVDQSGVASVSVEAGDVFAFVQNSVDCVEGEAATTVIDFFGCIGEGDEALGDTCNQVVIRTHYATDICDNVSTCVQLIYFEDTTPPSITCPATVTIECGDDLPTTLATATDLCDDELDITYSDEYLLDQSGCVWPVLRTHYATDDCGNVTTCLQTILIIDTTPPTITCPADVTYECGDVIPQVLFYNGHGYAVTSSSGTWEEARAEALGWGGDLVTINDANEDLFIFLSFGANLWMGYNDVAAEGTFEWSNGEAAGYENWTAGEPNDAFPGEDYGVTNWGAGFGWNDFGPERPDYPVGGLYGLIEFPMGSDICDESVSVSLLNEVTSEGSCLYTITRTYIAFDNCGLSSTCTQVITVEDTTPPLITCPDPITVECGSEIPYLQPIATDICNEVSFTFIDSEPAGECPMIVTRTHYAEDICGNVSSCTQYIYIEDTTPPVISCPAAVTIECDEDIPMTCPFAVDICAANELIETVSGDLSAGDPLMDGAFFSIGCIYPWGCDRFYDTYSFTVAQTGLYTFTGVFGPETFTIESDGMGAIFAGSFDPLDACTNFVAGSDDDNPGSILDPLIITCLLEAGDYVLVSTSFWCENPELDYTWTIERSDIVLSFTDSEPTGTCPSVITRTHYAEDVCGNISSCTQYIFIDDTTPPEIVCPMDLTLECAVDTIPVTLATATDNCSDTLDLTYSDEEFPQDCDNNVFIFGVDQVLSVIIRTHYATDECGNVSSCTQRIIIRDDTPPMVTCPDDVTIECDQDPNDLELVGQPIVTDLCDPEAYATILVTFETYVHPCSTVLTRVWQATDQCGNGTSGGLCVQIITILDTTPPSITCPDDLTVECGSEIPVTEASATDNCNSFSITYSDHICSQFGFTGDFALSNWTATEPEVGGDVDTSGGLVVLTGPDGGCPGGNSTLFSIVVPEDGTLVFSWDYVSSDVNGPYYDPFGYYLNGDFHKLTEDTGPGVVSGDPTQSGVASVPVQTGDVFAFAQNSVDCVLGEGATTVIDFFGCVGEGDDAVGDTCNQVVIRTFTAVDTCGNASNCIQLIYIEDTTPPVITCPALITVECGDTIPATVATALDICDDELDMTYTDSPLIGEGCVQTVLRTHSATDDCGNVAACVQVILIMDTTPPSITCPADLTMECGSNIFFVNGGFETMDFTGWQQINEGAGGIAINDGTFIPPSGDGPFAPCDGSHGAVTFQPGPGVHTLYQDILIPAEATSATLSWTDRIRNHALVFSDPNQEFRVEVWDPTDNSVLAELFSTNPGDPALNGCVMRTADLTAFAGQTVRIAFTEEDNLFFFEVHLDAVTITYNDGVQFATATDICDDDVFVTLVGEEITGTSCLYYITRTFVAIDDCGLSSTCTQVITVEDTTAPEISCPADTALSCDEMVCLTFDDIEMDSLEIVDVSTVMAGGITVNITAWSKGGVPETPSLYDTENPLGTDLDLGTPNTLYGGPGISSDDVNGFEPTNNAPRGKAVIIQTPTSGYPDDYSLSDSLVFTFSEPVFVTSLVAVDIEDSQALSGGGIISYDENNVLLDFEPFVGGNDNNTEEHYILQNGVKRLVVYYGTAIPSSGGISGLCFHYVPKDSNAVATYDACNEVTVSCEEEVNTLDECITQITRTFQPEDECGNVGASCTQTITLETDTEQPEIICPADLTLDCNDQVPAPDASLVIATDNCSDPANIIVTWVADLPISDDECAETLRRIYIATDECGNVAMCAQLISLIDDTPPVIACPADATIECGDPLPTTLATATDDCNEYTVTYVDSDPAGDCPMVVTRTHYAADVCGNVSSCTQYIYIEDTTPPTITCPDNITVECGSDIPMVCPNAVDICSVAEVTSISGSLEDGDPLMDGAFFSSGCSYPWIYGDRFYDTYSFTVTEAGMYVFDGTFGPNEGFNEDDDGMGGVFAGTFDPENPCENFVAGSDDDNPEGFWDPLIIVCQLEPGEYTLVSTSYWGSNPEMDYSWEISATAIQLSSVDSDPVGICPMVITRTHYATDHCGNVASCTQYIYIEDTTPPSITCPEDLTLECVVDTIPTTLATGSDICDPDIEFTYVDVEYPQDCANDVIIEGVDQVLSIIVRTHYATDTCGNVASCTQHIIIRDDTPPMVTCPDDVTIECDQDPDDLELVGMPIVTDLCDPEAYATIVITFPIYESPCSTVLQRVWIATDHCGNGNSGGLCPQVITILDTTPPSITCPDIVVIECGDELPTTLATGTDNCQEVAFTYVDSDPVGICPMVITRTHYASDGCGNVSSCTQYIIIEDTTPPALTCLDDVTIECGDTLPAPDWTVTDICDASPEVTYSDHICNFHTVGFTGDFDFANWTATEPPPGGDVTTVGTDQVILTGPDGGCIGGNSTLFSIVIPMDGELVFVWNYQTQDVDGPSYDPFGYNVNGTFVQLTDDGGPNAQAGVAVVPVSMGDVFAFEQNSTDCIFGEGATTVVDFYGCTGDDGFSCDQVVIRTYIATDTCGNESACAQGIFIEDTTAPDITCPPDMTLECDLEVPYIPPTVEDVCDAEVDITYSDEIIPQECSADVFVDGEFKVLFLIVRTHYATDDCGNVSSCTQHIVQRDDTPPQVTCPPNITVDCSESTHPDSTGWPIVVDNCDPEPVPTYIDLVGGTECMPVILRVWSATDHCGNGLSSNVCVQIITVQDTTPPVISCPADLTLECGDEIPTTLATATDDCHEFTVTYVDVVAGECPQVITRTHYAEDICGNVSTCVQTITIEDTTAPSLTCPVNVTIECGDPLPIAEWTAFDICDDVVATTYVESGPCAVGFTGAYAFENWTATEPDGGSVTTDESAEVMLVGPDGGACGVPTSFSITIPEDDTLRFCWTYSTEDVDPFWDPFGYSVNGVFTQLTDNDGELNQMGVATVVVTAGDVFAFVQGSVDCIVGSGATTVVGFIDCSITDNCESVVLRTFYAEDDCGNVSSCVQCIFIDDTTPPQIVCPADMTLECHLNIPATMATATDVCDPALDQTFVDEVIPQPCSPDTFVDGENKVLFLIVRTHYATDDCGNVSSCTQHIVLRDDTPPAIICPPNITIECDESTDPENTGWPQVTDNCDPNPQPIYVDLAPTGDGCLSTFIRVWTATDHCGNGMSSNVCIQFITLEDTTPPTITCPDDVTIECGADLPTTLATGTDNCNDIVFTYEDSDSVGDCPALIVRTHYAADVCGNVSSCTQHIYLEDTTPPTITCPEDLTLECAVDTIPTTLATAVDVCDEELEVTYVDVEYPQECDNDVFIAGVDQVLTIIVRTHIATDECGNSVSCTQRIVIRDDTPPSITCPDDITIECDQDPNDLQLTGVPVVTDLCDPEPQATIVITYPIFQSQCSTVLQRVWLATDHCGNGNSSGLCSQFITIVDTTPPVIVECPDDVTIECGSDLPTNLALATDNCNEVTYTYSDHICSHYGFTGDFAFSNWTAVEPNGGDVQTSGDQQVTLIGPDGVNCGGLSTTFSVTILEAGTLVFDWNYSTNDADGPLFDPFGFNVNGVFFQLTDDNGSDIQSGTASVPVEAGDVFAFEQNSLDCILGEAATTVIDFFGCVGEGDQEVGDTCNQVVIRTHYATDVCDNVSTCIQLIFIEDTTPPEIICPPTVTVECGDPLPTELAAATDLCDDELDVTYSDSAPIDEGQCSWVLFRTHTATDDCGNASSCLQVIIIVDTTPPSITCPADITVECGEEVNGAGQATATDACDDEVFVTIVGEEVGQGGCSYTIVRTYMATDDCGLSSFCTQTITVVDSTAPEITCPADLAYSCNELTCLTFDEFEVNGDGPLVVVDQLIQGGVTIDITAWSKGGVQRDPVLFNTFDPHSGDLDLGTPNVLYGGPGENSDDPDGYEITNNRPLGNILIVQSPGTMTPDDYFLSDSIVLNFSDPVFMESLVAMDFEAEQIATGAGIYLYDQNGALISFTALMGDGMDNSMEEVSLKTAGVSKLVMYYGSAVPGSGGIGSLCYVYVPCDTEGVSTFDVCNEVTVACEDTTMVVSECVTEIVRAYTAEDACGNSSSCTQVITLNTDNQQPDIICPADITIGCEEAVPAPDPGSVVATDNCSDAADITITWVEDISEGLGCAEVIRRVYSAVDECGNEALCVQFITREGMPQQIVFLGQVFLQAAMGTDSIMDARLNDMGYLPEDQPYTMAPYDYWGSEECVDMEADVVDWVLVQLRDVITMEVVAQRAALVKEDGSIVDADDCGSPVIFTAPGDWYYITVCHRNHLGILTDVPMDCNEGWVICDFTEEHGTNEGMVEIYDGVYAMTRGDVNGDNLIKYNGSNNDKNAILMAVGITTPNNVLEGYNRYDVNMDGLVKYNGSNNDKNAILSTVGLLTPNNVIQGPLYE